VQEAWIVDLEPRSDDRGFFSRAFCREEFVRHGLNPDVAQCNVAYTARAGTLRGLHYQEPPHAEAMLMRCTTGAVFAVLVDLRNDSPTFKRWIGVELAAANRKMVYTPEGCAHGYLTLAPDSEVFYQVSAPYAPGAERGVRWNDPAFGIEWPMPPRFIHPRDAGWLDFPL
jgi:dTDP-4-dehydrorhamnose 3,5-epimerase